MKKWHGHVKKHEEKDEKMKKIDGILPRNRSRSIDSYVLNGGHSLRPSSKLQLVLGEVKLYNLIS